MLKCSTYHHIPVMLEEVAKYLEPRPGQNFIDCTVGGGGHAIELAKIVGEKGRVLGLDLDPEAIKAAEERARESGLKNLILINDSYANLKQIIHERFNYPINGILFDLGLSSAQLEDSSRGFSFKTFGELDMRFSQNDTNSQNNAKEVTAKKIVNEWPEAELARIFKEYGEDPNARRIALEIVKQRKTQPISTTLELAKIIISVVGQRQFKKIKKSSSAKGRDKKIHPATRVFQALRIVVNKEIQNLKQTLPQAIEVLEPRGRLAVISYHSLEDRIVKNFFREEAKDCLCPPKFPVCRCGHLARLEIITKKPLVPTEEEVCANPRSRSARLRVAVII